MAERVLDDTVVEAAARAIVREEFRQLGYRDVSDEQIDRGIADDLVDGDDIRAQARAALTAAADALEGAIRAEVLAAAPRTLTVEVIAKMWRDHHDCNWVSTGVNVMWSCGIWHPGPIHMQPTSRDQHLAALVLTQIEADRAVIADPAAAIRDEGDAS